MDPANNRNAASRKNETRDEAQQDDPKLPVIKMCVENAVKIRWMQEYVERSRDEIQQVQDKMNNLVGNNNLEAQLELQVEINKKEEERCEMLEQHILSIKDIIEMLKKR